MKRGRALEAGKRVIIPSSQYKERKSVIETIP
jgi:hypothetical protein